MARAYQQSQPADYPRETNTSEWKSLRNELVALLDQVDSQVARSRPEHPLSERVRDLRFQVADAEPEPSIRHRDALKSVQRAITRFEEPAPAPSPNPRDSLQAAIAQIRSRQDNRPVAPPRAPPQPAFREDGSMLEGLAHSVTGLSGRLERLETEIRAQIKTGANVKDVADQVAQLAHVVELLAGAVGETGQVKRLEGQIASLGKIMSQGREMDVQTLTRRLDDVASTVGKLAELQVHYADRVENPVNSQAFKDGMASIETSVRNVYDRIDALERQKSLSPDDLDHVTAEMARFTEVLRENTTPPQNLIELVDALNSRISDIESGDRLLHGLRKDLSALRDSIIVSLSPRFDALEKRLDKMSGDMGTRDDFVALGRQIDGIGERLSLPRLDPGIGQLEAQVRQLVARMDQTGEQLSGLAKLYSEPTAVMPDIDAMAEIVATRAAQAVQRSTPDAAFAETISGLEGRIAAMLQSMHRDEEIGDFGGMQAGISEVNERLKRLEISLAERRADTPKVRIPGGDPYRAPADTGAAGPSLFETADTSGIAALIAEADLAEPMPRGRTDAMPRSPADEAPLTAPAYPDPAGPVRDAIEAQGMQRKRHPGLEVDQPLAARHDDAPTRPVPPPGFESTAIATPPAPTPSAAFFEPRPEAAEAAVPASSRNTFIEAARRAAQRQPAAPRPEAAANSLFGRALARFQTAPEPKPSEPVPPPAKSKAPKTKTLADSKPKRGEFKPEPVGPLPGSAASLEPQIHADGSAAKPTSESFLLRNRKTILLAAAVVAIALLTVNLVAHRHNAAADTNAVDATVKTGDIGDAAMPDDSQANNSAGQLVAPSAPRVIPLADSMKTGSIDMSSAQSFSTNPMQAMPSAFQAATDLASADPSPIAPLVPATSPVKVEMPPEAIGPLDLRQAAANGDPRAQFEVAAIYTEGRAVKQDYALAAAWYERAAAAGFAPAQYRLGSLYENGQGVAKDLDAARLWYERAAEAGNRMSMHNLAALYAGGQLGKQQFDSAAKWFEEAAKQGLTDSQFNLGMLYARGLGVSQDLEGSYKWFGIAALTGDKDAAKARDDIARSLDADTVNRLSAEVAAFKPAPIDLQANFAPIGTWTKSFDPGETIGARDIVASVQKALGKLGYDIGTPDGIAGPKTAVAIRQFEQATGMSEVGQINPRLLAVLGSQPV